MNDKPRSRTQFLAIALLLICIVGVGYYYGSSTLATRLQNGGLIMAVSDRNFGEVWIDDGFQWAVELRNTTSSAIVVSEFIASCQCVDVQPPQLTIPPHASAHVTLILDLTNQDGLPNNRMQEFKMQLVPVIAGDLLRQEGWQLRGRIKTPFLATPPALVYDGALAIVSGTAPESLTARIIALYDTTGIHARCDPAFGSVAIEKESSERYLLRFTPNVEMPAGDFATNIELLTNTDSGEPLMQLIYVRGTKRPEAYFVPHAVSFYPTALEGESDLQGTVSLVSPGGIIKRILDAESSSPLFTVTFDNASPSALSIEWVGQSHHDAGIHEASVVVQAERSDGTVQEFTLPVRAFPGPR